MYWLLVAAYVLTVMAWVRAGRALRWLLVGGPQKLTPADVRRRAYQSTWAAVGMSIGLVAATRIAIRSPAGHLHGALAAWLIGLSVPAVMALSMGAVYLVERRGRARQVRQRPTAQ